jgi:3-phytase
LGPAAIALILAVAACNGTTSAVPSVVRSVAETDAVPHDPDDPAVWIDAVNPSRSLIVGTDKIERRGGLYAFRLDGGIAQVVTPLDRPNNVDVEYGIALGGERVDIAVATERKQRRLGVWRVDATGLTDVSAKGGIPVLAGEIGEAAEPMGIALYRRPSDGTVFAIVAPKTGGATEYLWQYRLEDDGSGRVKGTFVRRFGAFSCTGATPGESGEIEAIVVDDALGYVYYSDERCCLRKYHADPERPDAAVELVAFGQDDFQQDREGLAVYARSDGTGYLVAVDQIPGESVLRFYRREGEPDEPHRHALIHSTPTSADDTDGLEIVSTPLPGFPDGLVVMMNSGTRNFRLYRWEDVAPR